MSIYTTAAYSAWIVVLVVWLIRQRHRKATVHRPKALLQHVATALILVSIVLLFGPVAPGVFGVTVTSYTPALGLTGSLLAVAGALFAVWARVTLGSNWSGGSATIKQKHQLIQRGPYGLVRHPIYTGIIAATLGTALTTGTLAVYLAVVLSTAGFLMRIRWEEELLTLHFPDEYRAYKMRCKAIIPYLL